MDVLFQSLEQLEASVPAPIRNEPFIHFLDQHGIQYSFDKKLRIYRAHGRYLSPEDGGGMVYSMLL